MEIAQIAVLVALAWMIIALVSNKVPFGAIGLGIPFILIIGGVFESPIKARSRQWVIWRALRRSWLPRS